MRIHWVRAMAFGALEDKTLTLGEGLNVVYGPNEAGKSTWHAALYAAICGHQPGAAQHVTDRRFDRYRPRGLTGWALIAHVEVDGRTVAALYGARLRNISVDDALRDLMTPLPGAHPNSAFRAALRRIGSHSTGARSTELDRKDGPDAR